MCRRNWGHVSRRFYRTKKKNKNIQISLSEPKGSSLYSYIKNDKLESIGSSITEGIGTGRITKNFDRAYII